MSDDIKLLHTSAGIPVITESISHSHSASAAVYFGTGSRDETDDKAGIAHLLEHMMFKGTPKRSSKDIAEEIEAAGGEHNGYTTYEVTCYHISSLDETFHSSADILSDMVKNPLLKQSDLDTERNVVIQEIRMMENDPDDYIHTLFSQTIWGGHPLGRSEAGFVETVKALNAEDLREFFEANYRPPRMAVIATGNIDEDKIVSWASENFDDLAKAQERERSAPAPNARFMVYPKKDPQAYICMGFPGLKSADPERHAQRLMSAVFGAGMSSRLFQEIREKTGMVYEIYSSGTAYTDCGTLDILFNTDVKKEEEIIRLVAAEIKKLKEEGLKPGELDRAKHMMKGAYVRRFESSEARMMRLGESYMATGKVTSIEDLLEKMDAVTEEDVSKIADQLLDRSKLSIAIHAPEKESKKAVKSLEDLDF